MQPWISMECFQLSTGKRLAQIDCLDLGHLQVVRERQCSTVQKLGATPADLCTISYCTSDPAFRFSDHAGSVNDSIFFMPERTEFDIHVPAGAQTTYISFSQAQFIGAARTLNPRVWDQPTAQIMLLRASQLSELRACLAYWLAASQAVQVRGDFLNSGVLESVILQSVLSMTTAVSQDTQTTLTTASKSRAYRLCRRAREHVAECMAAHNLPTIVDICASLAVSQRTLVYAFQEYAGMSPQTYLRLCRLNRVRATLLEKCAKDISVTQVAMQFGFLHLSRFAGDYKRLFEESPATTLARSA